MNTTCHMNTKEYEIDINPDTLEELFSPHRTAEECAFEQRMATRLEKYITQTKARNHTKQLRQVPLSTIWRKLRASTCNVILHAKTLLRNPS